MLSYFLAGKYDKDGKSVEVGFSEDGGFIVVDDVRFTFNVRGQFLGTPDKKETITKVPASPPPVVDTKKPRW